MTEPDWLDEYDRILRSPFPMRGRMRMLSHEWNDSDIERLVSEVKRLRAESDSAKAEAWQECVDWFALRGPLNGSERVKSYVLEEAEEANPYRTVVSDGSK